VKATAVRLTVTAILTAWCAGSANMVHAAPRPASSGELPPASSAIGAPSWVRAGTRITHHTSVATVQEGGYQLIEDPNGALVDPATGRKYREVFTALAASGGTGSGEAFLHATVVGLEGTDVVIARTSYSVDGLTRTFIPGASSGARTPGGQVADLWMDPTELAAMRSDAAGTRLVLHGPVTANGATYNAVSVVQPSTTSYAYFAYEATTGILVLSALRIREGTTGPVDMSITELRSLRQLAMPGVGSAVPSWARVGAELSYRGNHELGNPMDPAQPPLVSPVEGRVRFTDVGSTWALYQATITNPSDGSSSVATGAAGGIGPYWWDPAALAAMQPGQPLDTDPVTGMTVTVGAGGQGLGGPTVTILSAMPGIDVEATYDVASGVLVSHTTRSATTGITTSTSLVQMPVTAPVGAAGVSP
jgi:hypothetical protein